MRETSRAARFCARSRSAAGITQARTTAAFLSSLGSRRTSRAGAAGARVAVDSGRLHRRSFRQPPQVGHHRVDHVVRGPGPPPPPVPAGPNASACAAIPGRHPRSRPPRRPDLRPWTTPRPKPAGCCFVQRLGLLRPGLLLLPALEGRLLALRARQQQRREPQRVFQLLGGCGQADNQAIRDRPAGQRDAPGPQVMATARKTRQPAPAGTAGPPPRHRIRAGNRRWRPPRPPAAAKPASGHRPAPAVRSPRRRWQGGPR